MTYKMPTIFGKRNFFEPTIYTFDENLSNLPDHMILSDNLFRKFLMNAENISYSAENWAENRSVFCRVAVLHYGSPSHRVVEPQLLIPGFLPEFLETSGDQDNLRFLEKVASTGN